MGEGDPGGLPGLLLLFLSLSFLRTQQGQPTACSRGLRIDQSGDGGEAGFLICALGIHCGNQSG